MKITNLEFRDRFDLLLARRQAKRIKFVNSRKSNTWKNYELDGEI